MSQVHLKSAPPYNPTNSKVLDIMTRFKECTSTVDQERYITSLFGPTGATSTCSDVSGRNVACQVAACDKYDYGSGIGEGDREVTAPEVPTDAIAIAEVVAGGVISAVCGAVEGQQVGGHRTVADNLSSVGGVGWKGLTPSSAKEGGWERGRGRGRGRGQGMSLSRSFNTSEPVVGALRRSGGEGGGYGCSMISESNAAVELPVVVDVEGCGMSSWRQRGRGRGNFCSSSFTTVEKEPCIGRQLEGTPRGGWDGGTSIESGGFNHFNFSHIWAFEDNDLPLYSSTPSQSRITNQYDEFCSSEPVVATVMSCPTSIGQSLTSAAADIGSCNGCTALQVTVAALQVTVAALDKRVEELVKQKSTTSNRRPEAAIEEIFEDRRLMRVRAAALVTGRPLSSHMCKQLVLNIYDNEPPSSFNSDDIKAINERRECHDALSLSKWAVFELFSLQELVGRNCLGGGHDYGGSVAGANVVIKKPFDEFKLGILKTAVFNLYPQQNAALQKATWMKCVEKINTDVRYLFKVSMKKHAWLQLGLS